MGACNRLVMNLLKDITKSEYPVEIPVKHEPYVFEIVNKFINSTEFRTNFPLKMFDLARIKYHVTKNTQVSAVIRKLLIYAAIPFETKRTKKGSILRLNCNFNNIKENINMSDIGHNKSEIKHRQEMVEQMLRTTQFSSRENLTTESPHVTFKNTFTVEIPLSGSCPEIVIHTSQCGPLPHPAPAATPAEDGSVSASFTAVADDWGDGILSALVPKFITNVRVSIHHLDGQLLEHPRLKFLPVITHLMGDEIIYMTENPLNITVSTIGNKLYPIHLTAYNDFSIKIPHFRVLTDENCTMKVTYDEYQYDGVPLTHEYALIWKDNLNITHFINAMSCLRILPAIPKENSTYFKSEFSLNSK